MIVSHIYTFVRAFFHKLFYSSFVVLLYKAVAGFSYFFDIKILAYLKVCQCCKQVSIYARIRSSFLFNVLGSFFKL